LIFFLGNNTPVFAFFWANLRDLFGAPDLKEDLNDYLIDLYREYNAPLPKELKQYHHVENLDAKCIRDRYHNNNPIAIHSDPEPRLCD
jgi:hypothetical protein